MTTTGRDDLISWSGIDFDGTPPCEVLCEKKTDPPCGKPSVCRMRGTCPQHGTEYAFCCAPCRDDLLRWGCFCLYCARTLYGLRIC